MFITRECDYAVRIIRALAGGERMAVKDVCEAEFIPQPYAYKILKKLEKGALVQSHRGVYGGYTIAMPLDDISMYDIFAAVEDEMLLNECLKEGYECPNHGVDSPCKVHIALQALQGEMGDKLKALRMSDMVE